MIIAAVIAIALFSSVTAIAMFIKRRRDTEIWDSRKHTLDTFREVLQSRLREYDTDITVWIDKRDRQGRPCAAIKSAGHTYVTRADSDIASMEQKAADTNLFFAKKRLMHWVGGY